LRVASRLHAGFAVRHLVLPALITASLSTSVTAEPAAPGETAVTVPVAIGVNLPTGWSDAASIGGSLYVGLTQRLSIRANVASWQYHGSMFVDAVGAALQVEDESSTHGRITDIGAGVVHYGNKLCDGFLVEAGLLRRSKDISTEDEFASPEYVAITSTTYAARALVGYSWLIHDHFFMAFALGMSGGREGGTETTRMNSYRAPEVSRSIARWDAAPEGYLRLGGVFELGN
jgi:hypothetical protein